MAKLIPTCQRDIFSVSFRKKPYNESINGELRHSTVSAVVATRWMPSKRYALGALSQDTVQAEWGPALRKEGRPAMEL
jgi:hypothetical protein